MDKHVFLCETESEYESLVYETPHVALTEDDSEVHYDEVEEEQKYNLLDILWSDGKVTAEIREPKEGVKPVAVCFAPTDYFGEGEKARFVSVKVINYYGDKINGSASLGSGSPWGNIFNGSKEEDPLADMYGRNICLDSNTGQTTYYTYYWNKSLYDTPQSNNTPDFSQEGVWQKTYEEYKNHEGAPFLIMDINGKENFKRICEAKTDNWDNYYNGTYYKHDRDVKILVQNFSPQGFGQGEWYIGSVGEMLIMYFAFELMGLLNQLQQIYKKYPGECISSVPGYGDYNYQTSNPCNESKAYYFNNNDRRLELSTWDRDSENMGCCIPFIQL